MDAIAPKISFFFYIKKYGLSTRKKKTAMQAAIFGIRMIKMMKLAQ